MSVASDNEMRWPGEIEESNLLFFSHTISSNLFNIVKLRLHSGMVGYYTTYSINLHLTLLHRHIIVPIRHMANNETGCQNVSSDTQNDPGHDSLGVNAPFRYGTRVSKAQHEIVHVSDWRCPTDFGENKDFTNLRLRSFSTIDYWAFVLNYKKQKRRLGAIWYFLKSA